MNDATGLSPLRMFSHIRVTNHRHRDYGLTGTVIRIDLDHGQVWVDLSGGRIRRLGHRSVEVVLPKSATR